jgi:flagellar hook protein FlgE
MDLTTDYESLAMYGRDGSAPVPAGPGGTPAAVPAVFGAGAMGPRPVEGVALTAQQLTVVGGAARPATSDDVAAWNQAFTERVSELFSQDLQEAIRLGGVNVDPTILSFNPDGTINAENSINISFNTVPQVTAAQPANNHLRISDDYRLMFTVRNPGSFGNRYEINVETHSGDGVLAQWSGNVLTVRIPADGSVTQENIQTAINRAAAGRPDFYIDVEVQNTDGTITGITPATNLNPPPVAPATSRDMTAFINGRTLPVSLNNGTNSFFQEAFFSLTTMRLDGGAVRTPQDVSSVVLEIGRDGVIYGYHPVHKMLLLGRIDIVDFVNPEGLQQVGTSYFVETMASGPPQVNIPQTDSSTEVVSCALEMSNVDLSQEFSDMIITQRGFQANSRIITVSDSMLEELVNLKR